MKPDQYERAGEIFHAALALPPERRAAFLQQACPDEPDLLGEVESLLAAHERAGEFIEESHPHIGSLVESAIGRSPLDTQAFEVGDAVSPSRGNGDGDSAAADALLPPGRRLGRYEVVDLLGAGGMGRVYRALDPSLGREVAIKALAPTFRGDSASLRRFEREARVLATLSHPNIATIYGFEQLDGAPYLVLERVPGETLADRLARGPLPLQAALDVAAQIAAGLEEAHGKGVVHRDLKPSNVMLTPDGRVKLVDFGLAKTEATRPALDKSLEPITSPGVVLGTARYMSPEQVKGEDVDTRTDVWAFGCVLYEMFIGRPAFTGQSVSDVVAAVLRDEPNWEALPAEVPRHIARLLRRCLRRDVRVRLQHIGDARVELLDAGEDESSGSRLGARGTVSSRWSGWPIAAAALAVLAVLALLATIAVVSGRFGSRGAAPASPAGKATRLSLELPAQVTLASEFSAPFAMAPDGSSVVFEASEGTTQRLYVRDLADPALRALPGTEGARQPFFSADGTWVGFFANRKLLKVPAVGGPVLQVADVGSNPRGATWLPDDTIVFTAPQTAGLTRVAGSGGKPVPVTTLDVARGEASHRWPDALPGGRWVLFTVGLQDAPYDEARIEAVSLETGERRPVLQDAGFARYLSRGQLLFVRGGRLHAVGFDADRLEVQGTPEVVLDPVRYDLRNGGGHLAVASSGVFVYGPGEAVSSESSLAWVDRGARLTRISEAPRPFRDVRVSPDGKRIAAVIGTSAESDLWLVDANGALSRLTFGLSPHRPTWNPQGNGVTLGVEKDDVWRLVTVSADAKANPTVLFESAHRLYPNAWSPDGRHLIFQESRPDTGWDLRVLDVDAAGQTVGTPRAFANTPFHETNAAISLDGRWVSYESNELDGVFQVYIRSFPDGAGKLRASPAGARWPTWDVRGTLYYWQSADDTLWAVTTTHKGPQLTVGTPQAVWQGTTAAAMLKRIVNPVAGARYDPASDGARFLVLELPNQQLAAPLVQPVVVLGWSGSPKK